MKPEEMPMPAIELGEELVAVTSVSTAMEAAPVKGLLISAGIPVVERAEGAGVVLKAYTGANALGTQLLVPKRCEEEARGLLEAYSQPMGPEDELPSAGPRRAHRWKRVVAILCLAFLAGYFLWLYFSSPLGSLPFL